MGIVLAGNDVFPYSLDDDKGHDEADYKEDARIDHYMQKITVVFRGMAVGGWIVRFARLGTHLE